MTERELLLLARRYHESLFPKTCPHCGRRFATLREYIEVTRPVGRYMSYDVEAGDFAPRQLAGAVALANCPCGDTLALTTEHMPLTQRLEILDWIRTEAEQRGVDPRELVASFRDKVRDLVMTDEPGLDLL